MSETVLILTPSKALPRALRISWCTQTVDVSMHTRAGWPRGQRLAFATAGHKKAWLDLRSGRKLWIECVCFDLTDAEAQSIRKTLEPLGLTVEQDSSSSDVQAEAAYERQIENFYGGGGPQSLQEQYREAAAFNRSLK